MVVGNLDPTNSPEPCVRKTPSYQNPTDNQPTAWQLLFHSPDNPKNPS
jgi:hypothetical protein